MRYVSIKEDKLVLERNGVAAQIQVAALERAHGDAEGQTNVVLIDVFFHLRVVCKHQGRVQSVLREVPEALNGLVQVEDLLLVTF